MHWSVESVNIVSFWSLNKFGVKAKTNNILVDLLLQLKHRT